MNSKKEKEKETKDDFKKKWENKNTNTLTLTHLDKVQHTHTNNYTNNYDPYIHYQYTNTSLQNTFHILDTQNTFFLSFLGFEDLT